MSTTPTTELLVWHSVADGNLPDADLTVLMWQDFEDGDFDWTAGWYDGEHWHDAESGAESVWVVTHWAEPGGPIERVTPNVRAKPGAVGDSA